MLKLRFGPNGLPKAPMEIADEVELYARESGRHGEVHYVPVLLNGNRVVRGAWVVRMTLRPDDPRMVTYQEQRAGEAPTEDYWIHVPNERAGEEIPGTFGLKEPPYRGLDILELGAGGVRQFLERGNTWSGRGETGSKTFEQLQVEARHANEAMREKNRTQQRDDAIYQQRDKRRWRFKIPVIPVKTDLAAGDTFKEQAS